MSGSGFVGCLYSSLSVGSSIHSVQRRVCRAGSRARRTHGSALPHPRCWTSLYSEHLRLEQEFNPVGEAYAIAPVRRPASTESGMHTAFGGDCRTGGIAARDGKRDSRWGGELQIA